MSDAEDEFDPGFEPGEVDEDRSGSGSSSSSSSEEYSAEEEEFSSSDEAAPLRTAAEVDRGAVVEDANTVYKRVRVPRTTRLLPGELELAGVLSLRAKSIDSTGVHFAKVPDDPLLVVDAVLLARMEYEQGRCPLAVQRVMRVDREKNVVYYEHIPLNTH